MWTGVGLGVGLGQNPADAGQEEGHHSITGLTCKHQQLFTFTIRYTNNLKSPVVLTCVCLDWTNVLPLFIILLKWVTDTWLALQNKIPTGEEVFQSTTRAVEYFNTWIYQYSHQTLFSSLQSLISRIVWVLSPPLAVYAQTYGYFSYFWLRYWHK